LVDTSPPTSPRPSSPISNQTFSDFMCWYANTKLMFFALYIDPFFLIRDLLWYHEIGYCLAWSWLFSSRFYRVTGHVSAFTIRYVFEMIMDRNGNSIIFSLCQ
jgi:hypothetical protein